MGGFADDGACVWRGVVPIDVVDAARLAVELLEPGQELADLSSLAGDDGPRFWAGVDHWRAHPEFLAVASDPAIVAAVAATLGTERLWLYEDSVLVKDAGSVTTTRWHTDDGYFHVDGEHLATVWIPLDPASREAGALRFCRGSHRRKERYRPTLFVTDDAIPGTVGDPVPAIDDADPKLFGFDLAVGDLTIHHARTLHSAGGNATDTRRRALSIRYCGDDAVVRVKPGAPTKPGFDEIEAGTPIADAAARLGLPEVTA